MTIQFINVSFSYPQSGESVFEHISFQLDTEWKTGLIGRNGRGKTTLLKLLKGEFEGEYQGTVSRPAGIEYFPCAVRDGKEYVLSVAEEISGAEEWRVLRELSLLEFPDEALYRPFDTLSGGERTKALLAAMFLREGRFLLLDEPTDHLDNQSKKTISAYLRKKEGFVLVSHDRELLDECVDHILALNKTDVEVQSGNFSSWRENTGRREAFERARDDKLRKDIKRLKEAARRTADWSDKTEAGKFGTRNSGLKADRGYVGHKAAKMMKTSKVIDSHREKALEEKSALLRNVEEVGSLKISPLLFHAERLLEVKELSVDYGCGPVCREVSFSVYQGERVCLTGRNGCGKSSVLKAVLGKAPFGGALLKASRLKISYVAQDAADLYGTLAEYAERYALDESLFKAILRKLDFERVMFEKDIRDFSGGQKKKVLLAGSLCERAHLYIWDEPLNYIDVYSRMQLENLIRAFGPTMLFVEHDAAFLEATATKTVRL